MGHIYWELHEIPIPEGTYINRGDGRVFIMSDDGFGNKKRKVIGRATSEDTMHPNDLYKYLYPSLWKAYYGDETIPEHELHVGLYALALGIGYKTTLYPILHQTYGPLYGNAIMDYSMYSILERSDAAQLFPDRMSQQVLFSKEAFSDSWYSDLFKNKMTENANHQLRINWLKECMERGVTKVWLSIDGSNNNCAVTNSDLSEPGKAKSNTNSHIVSYIWAVSAADGLPVTYFVNNGSMVDSKAFLKAAEFLGKAGIEIEGVILDRGFCNHDVFQALEKKQYRYVVMLKASAYGHTEMVKQYSDTIRWKVPYAVSDKGIFGITSKKRLFRQHPEEAYITLFYDGANGTARSVTLISKIRTAARNMEKQISSGSKPSVPAELSGYLSLVEEDTGWRVEYNYDEWQNALDSKGFCSIACSDDFAPAEVDRLYHLRDASEKQFMIMKSQLGFDVTRVHSTEGIESKFAICFVASIIRSEIMLACQRHGYDTNQIIREINRITLVLMPDGLYGAINSQSVRQKEFLSEFGIEKKSFQTFADQVNRRMVNPINSQIHRMPEELEHVPGKRRGRPPKKREASEATHPKRKPGRPKGSKNKKTLLDEANQAPQGIVIKRKPGRPKGSKNKPKEGIVKRGPGRPRKDNADKK